MKRISILIILLFMKEVNAQSQMEIILPFGESIEIRLADLESIQKEDSSWSIIPTPIKVAHETVYYQNNQKNIWRKYLFNGLGIQYASLSDFSALENSRFNLIFDDQEKIIGYGFILRKEGIEELQNNFPFEIIPTDSEHEIVMKFANGKVLSCDDRFFLGQLYDSEGSFYYEKKQIDDWEVIVPIIPKETD